MGVYIKGMEMPTSCARCRCARGCPAVNARIAAMDEHPWFPRDHRHEDCPIVPVPDHGRLGDLDEAIKHIPIPTSGATARDIYENIKLFLNNAPTIIPADKESGE